MTDKDFNTICEFNIINPWVTSFVDALINIKRNGYDLKLIKIENKELSEIERSKSFDEVNYFMLTDMKKIKIGKFTRYLIKKVK